MLKCYMAKMVGHSLVCFWFVAKYHSSNVGHKSTIPRSRRSSDTGLGAGEAAASVALFPGSGTLAAATVGALGSVAAVAAGGVALLGGGVAAAAFKFSPSLNGETGAMSREERERRLEEIKKVSR